MNIGVLGSGAVGQVLAKGYREAGHQVMIGTRDRSKLEVFAKEAGVSIGSFAEAARHGEVIIFAVLGTGAEEAIRLAGADVFKGKLVLDTTNPLDFSKGFPPSLFVGHTDSLGERVQRWLPGAHVVKAFNTMGNPHMIKPKYSEGTPTHFIAGDDAGAKKRTTELLHEVGWKDVQDLGPISSSRLLESLCLAWCMIYGATGSGDHAFSLLRK
jgi:predicted dinucleotide-binding enzyme